MSEQTAGDIFEAIKNGETDRARELLKSDPELVNARGPGNLSPLMFAIYFRRAEMIAAFREAGSEIDVWAAAALGDGEKVAECLDGDPDLLEAVSSDGWTPLHLAAHFNQPEVVELLLARGAQLESVSGNAMSNRPLHAAMAGRALRAVSLLLDKGADPGACDAGGFTPLHQAAQAGNNELVSLLVARGSPVNARSLGDQTPLQVALDNSRWDTAKFLETLGGIT